MTALFITNGNIIDPAQGLDIMGSLLIIDDKISWLGRKEMQPPSIECDILDAAGKIVCPGFVDLHCHLRQPGYEKKETIATGTRAAARGGFTTVCCMPNTFPPLDNKGTIDYVKSTALKEGVIRVLPIATVTRNRDGEELVNMEELADAGAVAFSDDGSPVTDSLIMRQALEFSKKSGLPIANHCQDLYLSKGGAMNEGAVSAKLGLPGIPATSEDVMVARDIILAGATGGHIHICHVSTAGSVDLIRQAKTKGIRVTAEATPHHLTLTEDIVTRHNTNAKVSPPLRTRRDAEALVAGLKDGTIDVIATDHAPHAKDDKHADIADAASGISELETALGSIMGLVHSGKLPLYIAISKMTDEPARIIGSRYGKLGSLVIGTSADVTIFDPQREWVVEPQKFVSKGKNTPLSGTTLKGKVLVTIYQGKVVYQDESVQLNNK